MSDITPSSTPTSPSSELSELKEICADLQWQTHTLRIALLVVSCALCGFFFLEVRRNGQALASLRPQAAQVVETSKQTDPIAQRFLNQVVEYSKTHPDIVPVLNKLGIRPVPATAPAAPKK